MLPVAIKAVTVASRENRREKNHCLLLIHSHDKLDYLIFR